ncbi:MAG TPA: methionine--tRNA ligase [Longimicrobiales bacterium]|nr:methionine--tRNA ligase [Longimicrobiales bacterium]
MKKRYYITCAIDYANGQPHLGHAIEKIGGDAMARYRRRKGEDVFFVVGMDEHGLKVMQSAAAEDITPQQWVDNIARSFRSTWERLNISFDDFIRTTEPRHCHAVETMIARMSAAGDFYKAKYEGYYCVGCEAFKRQDELVALGIAGVQVCPIHPTREIVWSEEENWFFKLSRYQDRLLKLLDERPEFVQPDVRRNEIRKVIEGGLEDISVSRARLPWGIPWPGEPGTSVYVWIDALTNYLTAAGFPDERYQQIWPADWHVIGKDITRFHCIYWPAMLMSADVELPRSVWGHGFITFGGSKLSKSENVRVELNEAIERHGPDALRYFLLKDIPWNGDGEFSFERFDERYTADLANNFGNLANRAISMIERYRDGIVPKGASTRLDDDIANSVLRYRSAMDENLLHQGAAIAMELSSLANGFIEEQAPWSLAKDAAASQRLDDVLGALARAVGSLCVMLEPFAPFKMAELAPRLGLKSVPLLDDVATLELAGARVQRGSVLFPKPVS